MARLGFIYDQTLCIGCNACQMACKDKNNLEAGMFHRRADTVEVNLVPDPAFFKENKSESVSARFSKTWLHFTGSCYHCTDAPCIGQCSGGALFRQADGTVGHRKDACVGCSVCMRQCPYGAIKVSPNTHLASKCDSCYDLRRKGEQPACIGACPTHCLSFGDLDEFYENLPEEEKPLWSDSFPLLVSGELTKPNVLIKRPEKLIGMVCADMIDKSKEYAFSGSSTSSSGNGSTVLTGPVGAASSGNESTVLSGTVGAASSGSGSSIPKTVSTVSFTTGNLLAMSKFRVNPPVGAENMEKNVFVSSPFGSSPFGGSPFGSRRNSGQPTGKTALRRYLKLFESWDQAKEVLTELPDWKSFDEHTWKILYDRILRGCDPDLKVPLWASVSNGTRTLVNSTTLSVIKEYHSFGYEPVWMEGNPPDYIGEQIAFLLYLSESYAGEAGAVQAKIKREIKSFSGEYTLPTAQAMWQAVRNYKGMPKGFSSLLEGLSNLLKDRKFADNCIQKENSADNPSEMNPKAPEKLNPPIPDEPEHIVNTGGLNNCGGICVIRPHVAENCILRIESDCNPDHSPQIRACVRGRGYRGTFLNMDRLRYPMKRIGKRGSGEFERISWEEAVDLLYEKWVRIRENYGPEARYLQYGTGVEGIMRPGTLIRRLLNLDGGSLEYFNSYSSACVNYISDYVYGTWAAGNSPSDFLHTKLLILWADNTAESIFGPERNYYLAKVKQQGIRIIVVDPRLSQTGITYLENKADWFAPRPSTDAALADAMAYVIWSEGLQNQSFMDKYCIGFDEEHMPEGIPYGESYHSYLFGIKDGIKKTPEWAEPITGIEAERIRQLARLYATAKPACITAGLGAQRHGNGEQSARAVMMLCCLTGNVGIPGGSAGGNASGLNERNGISLFTGRNKNPFPGKIPVFLWTKAIEKGTEMTPEKDRLTGVDHLNSNIKLLFNLASDVLINQHSDINDSIRILSDESLCEFIVCSDIFMTPSARYADLILPAPSVFESENIINPWSGGNYLLKNNPVIRPLFGCRFEWEWMKELAQKLGYYDDFVDGKPEVSDWLRENYDILKSMEPGLPDYDTFSKEGGWQFKKLNEYVAFRDEIEHPETHKFATESGKIEIFSAKLYRLNRKIQEEKAKETAAGTFREEDADGEFDEVWAIPGYIPAADGPFDPENEKYPLQLIGWHTRRRCHSIHDNNVWQDEIEMPGVWINPEDAASRGIKNGSMVEIFNDHGRVRIPAIVTDRIRTGVTAISQGGWYTPDNKGTDTRGSINVLTNAHHPTPIAKGNPQHTNLVEIVPVKM